MTVESTHVSDVVTIECKHKETSSEEVLNGMGYPWYSIKEKINTLETECYL
jgi:restriction endonuclease S subunit